MVKAHIEATAAWEMYRVNKAKGANVLSQISMAHAESGRLTREWIKFVSRTLRYCATQEIATGAHQTRPSHTGATLHTLDTQALTTQGPQALEKVVEFDSPHLGQGSL